jgi:hypothetical protein
MRSKRFLVVVILATMFGAGASVGTAGAMPRSSTRTWAIEPTRSIEGALQNQLLGVSCASKRRCVGVGYSYSPNIFRVLTEMWDGRTWKFEPSPTLPGLGGQLSAVACTSTRDCVAVGGYSTTPGSTFGGTLAEAWNGRAWQIETTPNPSGAPNGALSAVSCTSKSHCVAVGSSIASDTGLEVTLAEVWDGHAWTIQSTPNPTGASTTTLLAVSCAAANACTAVGYSTNAATDVTTDLVEVWKGHGWTIEPTPDLAGSPFSQLDGVSCPSANACTAVGYSFGPSDATVDSTTEAWDGHSWAIQSTPSPAGVILEGVSCVSPSDCTAVGFSFSAGAFVMRLAGTRHHATWMEEVTAQGAGAPAVLSGVSCVTTRVCMVVGATGSASATAAERSS